MQTKNDCVFCTNEGSRMFCLFFEEQINPSHTMVHNNSGQAKRDQENCPGFKLDPHMKSDWESKWGG